MISKDLVELLVCPENHLPLELADDALLHRLNDAISAGQLKNKAGQPCERRLDAALVRQDQLVAYPVVGQVPLLLIDEGITLAQLD